MNYLNNVLNKAPINPFKSSSQTDVQENNNDVNSNGGNANPDPNPEDASANSGRFTYAKGFFKKNQIYCGFFCCFFCYFF